jgi:uncharacterized UBP type Zn finger protein
VDDEKLASLVDMGFNIQVAKRSLKKSNNDVDKALD